MKKAKIYTKKMTGHLAGTMTISGATLALGPHETDYIAQVVVTDYLEGLTPYARGLYSYQRLIELPVNAKQGDILWLFTDCPADRNAGGVDRYHTQYWLAPAGSDCDSKCLEHYVHCGDHLDLAK